MGGQVEGKTELTACPSDLVGRVIDVEDCPDLVPVLTVLASCAKGITRIIHAGRVRLKECDRLHAMATELNKIGGRNGVGITDIVENRLVGMKARGVYETPGGTILYAAHNKLEEICLDKDTLHYKKNLSNTFAELVYDGKWYTPLREALSAFVDSTQEYVTGDVKLKLYKGNIIDAGVTSPYSLYDDRNL